MATSLVVTTKDEKRKISVAKNLGANLEETSKLFGAETVHKVVIDKAKAALTAMVKGMLEKGKTDEEVHKAVGEFKLNVRSAENQIEKILKQLGGDKEKIAALLAKLQK